ncbi:MAG: hypothetical protein OXG72_16630 [Acidobacteria bacterium]|nr:hypothetical protein [Acidobacteriota bacterium]
MRLIRRVYPISDLSLRREEDENGNARRRAVAVVTRLNTGPDWFTEGALRPPEGARVAVSRYNHVSLMSAEEPVGMGVLSERGDAVVLDITYDDDDRGLAAWEYLRMRQANGDPVYWSTGFSPDEITRRTDESDESEPPFRTTRATMWESSPVTAPWYRETGLEELRALTMLDEEIGAGAQVRAMFGATIRNDPAPAPAFDPATIEDVRARRTIRGIRHNRRVRQEVTA